MSADRVDRTRAVTTRLTKCDPTKGDVSSRETEKYRAGVFQRG